MDKRGADYDRIIYFSDHDKVKDNPFFVAKKEDNIFHPAWFTMRLQKHDRQKRRPDLHYGSNAGIFLKIFAKVEIGNI